MRISRSVVVNTAWNRLYRMEIFLRRQEFHLSTFLLALFVGAILVCIGPPSVFTFGGRVRKKDPYRVPFCDPVTGECREEPDVPSPRTVYSTDSKLQYEQWWRANAILNNTASNYVARVEANRLVHKRPFVLYGDAILESFAGTNMQVADQRTKKMPEVLYETFLQSKYKLNVMIAAVGGDQTQHLLYRFRHGQLLPEFAQEPRSMFVVLIGTNNLGAGQSPDATARGIVAVVEHLLANTKGKVLLLKLLPRGDHFKLKKLCPPRCDTSEDGRVRPYKSFMPAIEQVNHALDEYHQTTLQSSSKNRYRFYIHDCGSEFVVPGDPELGEENTTQINPKLMPDRLHPNVKGLRRLADCILRGLSDGFDFFAVDQLYTF